MNTRKTSGFTLIELMVTLMVAGVVLGIGVPAFNELTANNQMATAANDLVSQFHLARTEAIKRRANVTICPSTDGLTCTAGTGFEEGWIVFVDCSTDQPPPLGICGPANVNVDGAFDDEVLHAHGALSQDIANNYNDDAGVPRYVSYAPTGFTRDVGGVNSTRNFQLCDRRGDINTGGGVAAGRWIQISVTGRPQIFRDQLYVQGGQNPLGGC